MNDDKKYEAELEFGSLLKSPSRLFGLIFPYFAILFLIVGIFFIKNLDHLTFNEVPAIYTDSLEITADVEVKKGSIMSAVDLETISNPSSNLISTGKELFVKNCSSCHGTEGKGDGVVASALKPPPRDFTKSSGWTNKRDFTGLYNTTQNGVPGTGMSAYEFIPIGERIAIIQYIRTLGDYPSASSNEVAALDKKYELSKGEATPGNISLAMSTEKLVAENLISEETVNIVLDKISASNNNASVSLFNKYASDKKKIIALFSRDYSSKKDLNNFIEKVLSSPVESGFKNNITLLSVDNLTKIYQMLLNVTG
ncbi:MAG: cytochrome c [Ignavibacteriae bacterium]|nr:cytochrome c [Ignavibacteriota bacterium]